MCEKKKLLKRLFCLFVAKQSQPVTYTVKSANDISFTFK